MRPGSYVCKEVKFVAAAYAVLAIINGVGKVFHRSLRKLIVLGAEN